MFLTVYIWEFYVYSCLKISNHTISSRGQKKAKQCIAKRSKSSSRQHESFNFTYSLVPKDCQKVMPKYGQNDVKIMKNHSKNHSKHICFTFPYFSNKYSRSLSFVLYVRLSTLRDTMLKHLILAFESDKRQDLLFNISGDASSARHGSI